MYHIFDEERTTSCVFVYDDSDGSVEYVEICNLYKLEGKFGERLPFNTIDFPFAKLRISGWEPSGLENQFLNFNLLSYKLGRVTIGIKLVVDIRNGRFNTIVVFTDEKVNLSSSVHYSVKHNITFSRCAFDYISKSDNEVYVSTNIVKLNCPTVMISWLLNLRSERNFDGIMQAFDNLFSRDINKIVINVSRGRISFEE